MRSEIVLLRHGVTEGNQKHWFYGWLDLPLSEEGEQELKELGGRGVYPELPGATQVFTTGLKRTEQTLQAVYGDLPHKEIKELKEYRFGKFEGHSFDELKEDPEFMKWVNDTSYEAKLEGGDSRGSFTRRVLTGADILMSKHESFCRRTVSQKNAKNAVGPNGAASSAREVMPEKYLDMRPQLLKLPKDMPAEKEAPILEGPTTLVVCHGGVISQLMRYWFDRPNEEIWEWVPAPGVGYIVHLEDGKPASYELFGAAKDTVQGSSEN